MDLIQPEAVRHIVIFKYKKEATEKQITQVTKAFRELKDKIPGILSFETGVNNSTEGLDLGFTHIYLLTFKDIKARNDYLPHEEHKKFQQLLKSLEIHERSFVVDYLLEN